MDGQRRIAVPLPVQVLPDTVPMSLRIACTPRHVVARSSRKNSEPSAPNVTCSKLPSDGSIAHQVPTNGAGGLAAAPPDTSRIKAPRAMVSPTSAVAFLKAFIPLPFSTGCLDSLASAVPHGRRAASAAALSARPSGIRPRSSPPLAQRQRFRTLEPPANRALTVHDDDSLVRQLPEGGTMPEQDGLPTSGKGSSADRLSQSPLSNRRGGADPTDVNDAPLNLDFGERHDYENPMKPSAPIEGTEAGEIRPGRGLGTRPTPKTEHHSYLPDAIAAKPSTEPRTSRGSATN